MNFRINTNIYLIVVLSFIITSCESEYSKLVKSEQAIGIKNDTLLMGLKFNDTRLEFFKTCQDLNKKKLISEGPDNKTVKYIIKSNDTSQSSIQMLYYGMFNKENIMTGLDMKFSYNSWAPWNKQYTADMLIPKLKDTLVKWFPGNEFIQIKIKKLSKNVFVKVDGNRQIKMIVLDDQFVSVKIENLDKKDEYNETSK